jgi:hypothetical protein
MVRVQCGKGGRSGRVGARSGRHIRNTRSRARTRNLSLGGCACTWRSGGKAPNLITEMSIRRRGVEPGSRPRRRGPESRWCGPRPPVRRRRGRRSRAAPPWGSPRKRNLNPMPNTVSKESLELAWKADRAPIRELGRNVDRARRVCSARAGCRVRAVRPVPRICPVWVVHPVLKVCPVRAVRPTPVVGRVLNDRSVWTVG